jgi:hypothetical protein
MPRRILTNNRLFEELSQGAAMIITTGQDVTLAATAVLPRPPIKQDSARQGMQSRC